MESANRVPSALLGVAEVRPRNRWGREGRQTRRVGPSGPADTTVASIPRRPGRAPARVWVLERGSRLAGARSFRPAGVRHRAGAGGTPPCPQIANPHSLRPLAQGRSTSFDPRGATGAPDAATTERRIPPLADINAIGPPAHLAPPAECSATLPNRCARAIRFPSMVPCVTLDTAEALHAKPPPPTLGAAKRPQPARRAKGVSVPVAFPNLEASEA